MRRFLTVVGLGLSLVVGTVAAFDSITYDRTASAITIPPTAVPSNPPTGKRTLFVNSATGELSVRTDAGVTLSLESAGASGAPIGAEYWVGTANGTLTNEKNVGGIGTGLVINTAGVPSAYAGTSAGANLFLTAIGTTGIGTFLQPDFSNLSGAATDAQIPNNITVTLAATATALAANGGNCAGNNFALGVDASGVGECAQPAFSNLSGAATDAQVPDNITVTLAATSTALAADPANCSAGSVAGGVNASGTAESCLVSPVNTAATATQFFTAYTAATGVFTKAQPAFTDISGAVTDAQVPDNITITGAPVTLVSTGAPTDALVATYTAIPGIAFTPLANTRYLIDCLIIYTSSAATTGINFAWDVPTAVNFIHMTGTTTTTALGAVEGFSQRADNVGTSTANAVITVQNIAELHAVLSNGANATSTTLGFTPETANSVAVIAGSVCQYQVY